MLVVLSAAECKLQDVHKSLLNSREIQRVHLTILCVAEVIYTSTDYYLCCLLNCASLFVFTMLV